MATYGGFEGDLKIGTSLANMRASTAIAWQSFDLETKNNLKRIFRGGQREPEEIKELLIETSAKISRYFRDKTTLSDRAGVGATTALTSYWIGFYPNGYAVGNLEYYVSGKFDTWKLSAKHDDVFTEEAEFIDDGTLTVGTVPS